MATSKQRRISDVSFKFDADLNVVEANRSFLKLFNVVDSNINLGDFMNSSDKNNFAYFIANFHYDVENPYFIAEFNLQDRFCDALVRMDCIIQVERDGDFFSATLQEISYLFNMLGRMIFENRKYTAILNNFHAYFITYNGERFLMQNTGDFTDLFESDKETFKSYFVDFFKIDIEKAGAPSQLNALFDDMCQRLTSKTYQFPRKDGSSMSVRTSVVSTREKTEYIALISTDGEIVVQESFAEKFDGLTNLYNKKTVTEMLKNKINVSRQSGSLFIIDVDKFKECNDNFGHAFGDKVLSAVSKVIRDSVINQGFAGRIGGDEFICFVDKTEDYDVRNIARSIRLGVQWAIPAINPESVVTTSIGIARISENASSYEEAFKLADKCLYIAKSRGRNCYVIYRPKIHDKIIMQSEDSLHNSKLGKTQSESANRSIEILKLIMNPKKDFLKEVIPLLIEHLGVHKITIYKWKNGKYSQILTSGYEDVKFRDDKLDDSYFKYYNSYGFFHIDNLNIFDTIDKEKYNMYLTDKVTSTLEVKCDNDDGSPNLLVCYDVFKPAQTFPPLKIEFGIMVARMIAKNM